MILMLAIGVAFLFVSRARADDITGDGKVNMDDVMVVLNAWGSYAGHPRWNATADISGPNMVPDGVVDMQDVIMVLMEFGQTFP